MSDDKIPYGAEIPEPPAEDVMQEPEKVAEPPKQEDPPKEPDWKKNYDELRSTFNKRDGEIKSLRDELASLREQSAKQVEKAQNEPPPTDYEKVLKDLAKQYDDGDITFEQALTESNRITREMTKAESNAAMQQVLQQANQAWQQELQYRDGQAQVNEFYKNNPDYQTLDAAGELDKVVADNPLMDKLSAYYMLQANKAKELAAQEFERGKQESARIAAGSAPAGKVLQDPGTSMQQQRKPKPSGEAGIKASMMERLRALEQ